MPITKEEEEEFEKNSYILSNRGICSRRHS
jgi:hypothetical protein